MSNQFPTLLDDGTLIIRASSTPSLSDCERRTVARGFPELLKSLGYELREVIPHIGAAVGIGVHACAEVFLKAKVDTGEMGDLNDAQERGIMFMRFEVRDGAEYDKVSPNLNVAERQVAKMARAYRYGVAPNIKPVRVERRLTAEIMPGYEISGQADSLTIEPKAVRDLKTGANRWPNHAQLGCYGLLSKTWDHPAEHLFEDFIARVPINQVQPPAQATEYDLGLCERIAHRRLTRLIAQLEEFKESADPQVFYANPMSKLCQDRFCPAWGTKFCREHRT
jgi:hypothetical protein